MSNRHANNVISNGISRLTVQRIKNSKATSFEKKNQKINQLLAKFEITKTPDFVTLGANTIILNSFMAQHQIAGLSYKGLQIT